MLSVARYEAAKLDRQLVEGITRALHPFKPADLLVYRTDDPIDLELRVRFAGNLGVRLLVEDRLRQQPPAVVILELATRVRTAWHAMTPLEVPDNIVLGTD